MPDTPTAHRNTLAPLAIYDNGPSKTVRSYEPMTFDLKAQRLQCLCVPNNRAESFA